ncbi:hypothetical protein HMPREF9103_00679 [Lentilactobacillus parafarraginis F0439]|uniref:Uncharacterized protein n=1 Tax=Lentilactobacillus parafarraginis F0439 TaxID=797515 RepID=G9ZLT1_9LACO|nr:hypothetical protein HMPREF9103_00679 [Lentilactobacillus parafarraginis F0439]
MKNHLLPEYQATLKAVGTIRTVVLTAFMLCFMTLTCRFLIFFGSRKGNA